MPRFPHLLPTNPQALTVSRWSRVLPAACPRLAGASSWQRGHCVIRNSANSLIASSSPQPGGWRYSELPWLPLPKAKREEARNRSRLAWRGPWGGPVRSEGTMSWRTSGERPEAQRGTERAAAPAGPSVPQHSPPCGCLPAFPACPTHAQNGDIKPAKPMHSLFRWHKNHYKNLKKEPQGAHGAFPASVPELLGRGGRQERKEGNPGSAGISRASGKPGATGVGGVEAEERWAG